VATRKVPKKAHILAILKILLAKLLILAEKKGLYYAYETNKIT
jgi:hypothetical protein